MERDRKSYILVLDLIRLINVISLSLLLGLWIAFWGVNAYISLMVVLLMSILLSNVSQKLFVKKFGTRYSISGSKIFFAVSIIINVIVLVYYLMIREYALTALIIAFYMIYHVIRKKF